MPQLGNPLDAASPSPAHFKQHGVNVMDAKEYALHFIMDLKPVSVADQNSVALRAAKTMAQWALPPVAATRPSQEKEER